MNKIINPSIDISINFLLSQEKICHECYKEIVSIFEKSISEKPALYNKFEIDTIDLYSDGWYFNIYIALSESELLKTIIEIIMKYNV